MSSKNIIKSYNFLNSNNLLILIKKGLPINYKSASSSLLERLDYELNVIESLNATEYFLFLSDIINYLNHLGLYYLCPGTANASLVCYCLGLTDIDPIEHDLLFESFIIPGQKRLPSITLEVDSIEKREVKKAILEKYGLRISGSIPLVISGRKNLKVHMDTINRIQKKSLVKINTWKLPLDDKKTWAYFQKDKALFGDLISSGAILKKVKKYRLNCFNDLLTIVSLSNQKSGNEIKQYFLNRNNRNKIFYPHPALQTILEDTMGTLMFQDQILRIAQIIGGFTLEEARYLIKALGNKNKKVIEKQAAVFSANAQRRKIAKRDAMAIYSKMKKAAPFVLYKSEAVAEAYLAYQGAYIKAHYPEEFFTPEKALCP